MKDFLLYYIRQLNKKPADNLKINVGTAIIAHRRRYGTEPTHLAIRPADLPPGFAYNGLVVQPIDDKSLQKLHFRLWREHAKS